MTWQDDITARWSGYAKTGFPTCVLEHREKMAEKANETMTVDCLKPSFMQAMDEMVPSLMDDIGVKRFPQGMTRTVLDVTHCRTVFPAIEKVRCSVLKMLTAIGMVWSRAVSVEVTQYDEKQSAAVSKLK